MADIKKLRELGKPRLLEEEKYFNKIIEDIEAKMLEVAPYDDKVAVIFIKPGYAYGCCGNTPDNRVLIDTNKFNKFGKYLHRIEGKYHKESFNTFISNDGYILTISWEE